MSATTPKRLAQRVAEHVVALGRNLVAELPRALAAEVAQNVDGALHLAFGFGQRFAFFASHLFADLREAALQEFRRLEEILSPARRGRSAPGGLRLRGRLTRRLHILRAGSLEVPNDFRGVGGIGVREGLPGFALHPLAGNVIAIDFRHREPPRHRRWQRQTLRCSMVRLSLRLDPQQAAHLFLRLVDGMRVRLRA